MPPLTKRGALQTAEAGKEANLQKIDFLRLFTKKVVSNTSRSACRTRKRVIIRKKAIFLKFALDNNKKSIYDYSIIKL